MACLTCSIGPTWPPGHTWSIFCTICEAFWNVGESLPEVPEMHFWVFWKVEVHLGGFWQAFWDARNTASTHLRTPPGATVVASEGPLQIPPWILWSTDFGTLGVSRNWTPADMQRSDRISNYPFQIKTVQKTVWAIVSHCSEDTSCLFLLLAVLCHVRRVGGGKSPILSPGEVACKFRLGRAENRGYCPHPARWTWQSCVFHHVQGGISLILSYAEPRGLGGPQKCLWRQLEQIEAIWVKSADVKSTDN